MFKRFDRWAGKGVWDRVVRVLDEDADLEWLLSDSTVVRAHQHAAGKKRGQAGEALGRSRGGFTTGVHIAVDALGNPVRIRLTPSQASDISQGEALVEGFEFEALIADKGYDSDPFIKAIESRSAQAAVPPRKNRIEQRRYDRRLDKARNLVERFINRVKRFRREATRYEKTARNYLAFWQLASITVLLR